MTEPTLKFLALCAYPIAVGAGIGLFAGWLVFG